MFYVTNVHGQESVYRGHGSADKEVSAVSAPPAARAVAPRPSSPPESLSVPREAARQAYAHQATKRRQLLVSVEQIMSRPVLSLGASESVVEAEEMLSRAGVRHLPVLASSGNLVGMLSERDVLRARAGKAVTDASLVSELMTQNVLTARPNASVRDAAKVMFEARAGSLPIVDDGSRLLGIVTRSDILQAVLQHAPLELWA